jgi:hypothetical protein
MSKANWERRGRYPRSLFWPLTLIIIGLVFLSYNLGLLNDDAWSTLVNLWPLLLVLIGLDSILDRSGIVGPSLMIGLGVVFLLNNFGYLILDVWQVVLSLWPVLLIAVGFDLLIGRRSWLLSLVGVIVVLAILIGAISLMGGTIFAVAGQEVNFPLEGVERAQIEFDIPVGTMTLEATAQEGVLLEGQAPEGGGMKLKQQFQVRGGEATVQLGTTGGFVAVPGITSPYRWDFRVTSDAPLDLRVGQGAGALELDLMQASLTALEVNIGVGQVSLILPSGQSFSGRISGGIGQLVIYVPADVGVHIRADTALAAFSAPDGYVRSEDVYTSPNYSTAEYRIDLELDLAIGNVTVKAQ